MKKIKILLIGSAFAGDLHMDAYSRIKDKIEIAAICSKDIPQAHALAARYGFTGYETFEDYAEAIEKTECDLVDICVPNFMHYDVCMKALNKNRDVICEKPLATTVSDGETMIKKADEIGKHIYYAEDWLFAPAVIRATEIIEEGAIGKPVYLRARETHCGSHSPFAQTIKFCGGGCLLHLGIHPVAFILSYKNNEWTEITATVSGGFEKNLIHKKLEGEDWACCSIKFKDGTTAVVEANYVTSGGMEDMIDFYGDKGVLHIDLNFSGPISCFSIPGMKYTVEKAEITNGWSRPAVDEKLNLGYVGEINHFVDCCANNKPAKNGLRGIDGLNALKVVDACYRSAREGRVILNEV